MNKGKIVLLMYVVLCNAMMQDGVVTPRGRVLEGLAGKWSR